MFLFPFDVCNTLFHICYLFTRFLHRSDSTCSRLSLSGTNDQICKVRFIFENVKRAHFEIERYVREKNVLFRSACEFAFRIVKRKSPDTQKNDSVRRHLRDFWNLFHSQAEDLLKVFNTTIDTYVNSQKASEWIFQILSRAKANVLDFDISASVFEALSADCRVPDPPDPVCALETFFSMKVEETICQCEPSVASKFQNSRESFDRFHASIISRARRNFQLSTLLRDFFIHLESAKRGLDFYKAAHLLIETVRTNDVTVVATPTGSGKSTLMPLLILSGDIGISRIAVTQPRRLAASSIHNTITKIHGEAICGFAMADKRENSFAPIVYITDGLLRTQFSLSKPFTRYDCIIIDEVHERSEQIDACIALLAQMKNQGLAVPKIVLSSATIDPTVERPFRNAGFSIKQLTTDVSSVFTRTEHYPDIHCRHDCKICLQLAQTTMPITIITWMVTSGELSKGDQLLIFMPTVVDVNKCVADLRERNIVAAPLFAGQRGDQNHYLEEETVFVSTKYAYCLFRVNDVML